MSKKELNLSAANLAFANTIVQQLDDLSARRKQWEATDYKKANEGLYALLAECLDVFNARFITASDEDKIALRKSLMQRLQADGIRVVKTSTTLTMLARFVFNSDRKRAQGYSYVLAAAVSHGVDAAGFAAWVSDQGGLEEIKRKMVKSEAAKKRQEEIEAAKAGVKGDLELNALQPLAQVAIEGVTGKYAVLLAKPNLNGGVDIVGTLSEINDALVNALIQRMAKQQVAKAQADAELDKQVKSESSDMLAGVKVNAQKVVNG